MTDTGDTTAELYLRTFSTAADKQRETVGRLEALAESGPIDSLTIDRWGNRIDIAERNRFVEAFRRFREWADRRGISITPPFAIRTYRSAFTGESCEVLVTPVMFLATYTDGELDGLFPHQQEGTVTTIEDYLATLETAGPARATASGDTAVIR